MSSKTSPSAAAHVSGQANDPLSEPPHSLGYQQVLDELKADRSNGLTAFEAATRLGHYGPNQLKQKKGVQPLAIFIEQIFNAMTLVLLLAVAASFGIKAWIPGGILAGIIILNIFVGFFQSLQAEKTINSLQELGSPSCNVFRDNKTITIQTTDVVPGDIVDLGPGDSVPADIRLVEAVSLEADEALLTGESAPVSKSPSATFDANMGPGDRLNVVFSSTTITKGRGRGVVFATGMYTEIGLIAAALQEDGKKRVNDAGSNSRWRRWAMSVKDKVGAFLGLTVGTPLQIKLSQLFIGLLIFAIICAIIVLGANKFATRKDVIIYAVTVAVGTIPVSLLLVLTVTMAAGTKKMLERHVIVRNLSSLEALGGVTNICSDKTGTITQGRMVVKKAWIPGCGTYSVEPTSDLFNPRSGKVIFAGGDPKDVDFESEKAATDLQAVSPAEEPAARQHLSDYLNVACLANLATLEGPNKEEADSHWAATGAPTDIAIEVFASRFGWTRPTLSSGEKAPWIPITEFPFDSDVKKMTVLFQHRDTDKTHVFTKGAVERVLTSCSQIVSTESVEPITESDKNDITLNMENMARQGLRVLALAHKVSSTTHKADDAEADMPGREQFECDLIFRGLIGIYDPPRLESLDSVHRCHGAGISVHMLTGDHPQTARAIAVDVAILPSEERIKLLAKDMADALMMPAVDFDALSDDQIDKLPQLPLVVARCTPSTKVRMIEALHRRNCYVAMTGDGVNDSPSLKRADIGIAMGTGSDVAKESSDIVLTDDNFASILNAIEEGRRIFDNIQKFIMHVLAANIGFVLALLIGLAFKDSSDTSVFLLTPVEIIWMLMATGAFCETGLGFEKAVPDVLQRPPMDLKWGVFTPEFLIDMVYYGLVIGGCVLGSFALVIWGFGTGNLGRGCNNAYSTECDTVFRARATSYATMTWIFVIFAWELIDFRRSFFYMPNGIKGWAQHLWGNQFLFYAVTVVFAIVFPTVYIPVVNHKVFLHTGITWEWVICAIALFVFLAFSEAWKWAKRVYFRRKNADKPTSAAV